MNLIQDQLRSIVIECLRKDRPYSPREPLFSRDLLFGEVAAIARRRHLKYNPSLPAWRDNAGKAELHPNLRGPVSEIVWHLIVEGIICPGSEHGDEFDLPYVHVTDYGKEALKDSGTPYDPDGYLAGIKDRIPGVNPIILGYIAESAETLRRNCLLASTITLGCAAEKAFLLLLDAYEDALDATKQADFHAKREKTWMIKSQHDLFMAQYQSSLRSKLLSMGRDWLTRVEHALQFLFSYFRWIRNDAGHPTGAVFSREEALSHLVIFPSYLRSIYDLIEWLDANRSPS